MTVVRFRRGRWPALVTTATVVVSVTVWVVVTLVLPPRHHASGPRADQRPPRLPAASATSAPHVTTTNGTVITCPIGAEPAIVLDHSSFIPALTEGRIMGRGIYKIVIRGTVQNETSAPIVIRSVTVHVNDARWSPTVSVAASVPAQQSADLVIRGTYHSAHAVQPAIHTDLSWQWQAAVLAPCTDQGLIEDD
jgi:hypothetical protein